jgi:hypothetical protein
VATLALLMINAVRRRAPAPPCRPLAATMRGGELRPLPPLPWLAAARPPPPDCFEALPLRTPSHPLPRLSREQLTSDYDQDENGVVRCALFAASAAAACCVDGGEKRGRPRPLLPGSPF